MKPSNQRPSMTSSTTRLVARSASMIRRVNRAPSSSITKYQQQQQPKQSATTLLLQSRERLRVYVNGEDVTPRNLVHPVYGTIDDRRTAFDQFNDGTNFSAQRQRSVVGGKSTSSFSSVCTLDEILRTTDKPNDRVVGKARRVDPGIIDVDDDAPSEYRLPRHDSREFKSPNDLVTLILNETDTLFIFEMPQLTENAESEAGRALTDNNERYSRIRAGVGRKTLASETQTPRLYTKTRSTLIDRRQRKNRATLVNNWIMHDTYANEDAKGDRCCYVDDEACGKTNRRYKFSSDESDDKQQIINDDQQLETIGNGTAYENAARITLRVLASKDYELSQKRFAGLIRQDPCDPDLELCYGLELLWRHSWPETRSVSAVRWNPANRSLLAVGYAAVARSRRTKDDETTTTMRHCEGIVLIWCAKNPTAPDRCFEFESQVSDVDWSKSSPNLLAVGFYDGGVSVVDVTKKQLCVVFRSRRKTSFSYEPQWQVRWWPMDATLINYNDHQEQLYTSNQDGRICYFLAEGDFEAHEIFRLQRIEGKIPGIDRSNNCVSRDVPISRNPGALVLCRHPEQPSIYLVGTDEGCVMRCSTSRTLGHLGAFVAHDGPVYALEYSPFCGKLLLSCGADWTTRIWAEGLEEPIITYRTRMAFVADATWSPSNCTIFASIVANEICVWDIKRKTHRPASITKISPDGVRLTRLAFTRTGEQIVAADERGEVYVYGLVGMPLPAYDQKRALVDGLSDALVTKPEVLRRLKKILPFDG